MQRFSSCALATALLGGAFLAPEAFAQEAAAPSGGVGGATTSEPANDSDSIVLNFRGASLESVLNYLSEAAGFVVMSDADLKGTVNVWSAQPLNREEAIDLLDAVLSEKGYTAVRNGRLLKIVSKSEAYKYDLPVKSGADPQVIPKSDSMVTQILPVRYGDAKKLLEDLSQLIPEEATVAANESSNAIVITDTQTNIHRLAEIIAALDTSISSISTIRVFPLRYADASKVAEIVTSLFQENAGSSGGRGGGDGGGNPFDRFRFGGRGGGGDRGGNDASGSSEARQAASRVVALADERTNSLVIGAPDEYLPTIEALVTEIDTNVDDITDLEVFTLKYADASEMAEVLTQVFNQEDEDDQNNNNGGGGRFPFPFGGGRSGGGNNNNSQAAEGSYRMKLQSKVVAVADARTNSVIVSASAEVMKQIGKMVEKLDSDSSRKQKVFVYKLQHADVDNVSGILRGMFQSQTSASNRNSNSTSGNNILQNRANSGAAQTGAAGGGTRNNNNN